MGAVSTFIQSLCGILLGCRQYKSSFTYVPLTSLWF